MHHGIYAAFVGLEEYNKSVCPSMHSCCREEITCYPCSQYTTVKTLVTDDIFPSNWLTCDFSFFVDIFPCATREGESCIRPMACSRQLSRRGGERTHMLWPHFPVVRPGTWAVPARMGRVCKNAVFLSLVLSISNQKNRNKYNCTKYARQVCFFSLREIITKNLLKMM